jgi:hypothetical protein
MASLACVHFKLTREGKDKYCNEQQQQHITGMPFIGIVF